MHLCDATPWWLVVANVAVVILIVQMTVYAAYLVDKGARRR
jgi:uncharacterized protein (UPF0212 family)